MRRGRRPVVAGIDIGGTTTSAVIADGDAVVGQATTATPARDGGAAMLEAAVGAVEGALTSGHYRLVAVGVGTAGVIDPREGAVVAASDSFGDWVGYRVADELHDAFGVPVVVENDVNAFVEGERRFGAARGLDDVLGVMLGTGVGGALILSGRLYTGPNGSAGEIGHVPGFGDHRCSCGRTGHLETLASGRSILLRYQERVVDGAGADMPVSAADVAAMARAGDANAAAVFDQAGRAVGRAAVMVATLVDVTRVVVGGGVLGAWDLLEPAIKAELAAEPPVSGHPIMVIRGVLGDSAVAMGAAALAGESLRKLARPTTY